MFKTATKMDTFAIFVSITHFFTRPPRGGGGSRGRGSLEIVVEGADARLVVYCECVVTPLR